MTPLSWFLVVKVQLLKKSHLHFDGCLEVLLDKASKKKTVGFGSFLKRGQRKLYVKEDMPLIPSIWESTRDFWKTLFTDAVHNAAFGSKRFSYMVCATYFGYQMHVTCVYLSDGKGWISCAFI